MKTMWKLVGSLAVLSLAACGGGGSSNETTVCTGTISGAVTGTVKFCSLEASKLNTGDLVYTLSIEPASGGTIDSNGGSLVFYTSGDPKTGTLSGTAISQATGSLNSTSGNQYVVQQGLGGTNLGSVSLTIDSVPTKQDAGNGNALYQWFGGKATLQYAPPEGSSYTGTVNVTLDFKPQS